MLLYHPSNRKASEPWHISSRKFSASSCQAWPDCQPQFRRREHDMKFGRCIINPRYCIFRKYSRFLTTLNTFSTFARTDDFLLPLGLLYLRRIRWNVKQLYVFRDMKLVRLVPCCTITTQQDQIIRVLLGQFLKKYVHTSRIAIRHNKKTGASRYWFNSSVCIPIFTNVMARYRWTNALFTPAVFGLIDSSESCFILEHKSYFLMWMTRLVYIIL